MKRFVVALVAVLAIFTFIRDFSGSNASAQGKGGEHGSYSKAELIP
jgi:hypothetical protein